MVDIIQLIIDIIRNILDMTLNFGVRLIELVPKPFPNWPIFNLPAKTISWFSKTVFDTLSKLPELFDLIKWIVVSIVGVIADFFALLSAALSLPTLGASGFLGGTASVIFKNIIIYLLTAITVGFTAYFMLYTIHLILYYVFHIFFGLFISKLLAWVLVVLIGSLITPFIVTIVKNSPKIVEPIHQKLVNIVVFIKDLILKIICIPLDKFRRSEIQKGGGDFTNRSNYEIHIQILTLFFSSLLIVALLNKVYELYYEKEETEEENKNNND